MKFLTRTILLLSLISLFTDMASEMLYPIMPLYLQEIGFSVAGIGMLEGLAEAVAGISKGYFGKWADARPRRAPFVQLGYGLSAISKPLMAFFIQPLWIFLARTIDRLGKGVRTGARDALLAAETNQDNKGRVFGFHRSMDTLGAVLGPAIALLFLNFHPGSYRNLFLWAFIPGVLAIGCSLLIKEKKKEPAVFRKAAFFDFLRYWNESTVAYRRLVRGLLLFALINSSDVFLLLQVKAQGFTDNEVILLYIFYNIVYAVFAFPAGILADRWGVKKTFLAGLCLFSAVYLGMAFVNSIGLAAMLFLVYGIYAAFTEGVAKAWMAYTVDSSRMGTAVGTYSSFQSIAALIASTAAGWLWILAGARFVFLLAGVGAFLLLFYFARLQAGNRKFATK